MNTARHIVSSLPDPAILLDHEFRAVFYNALYVQFSGYRSRKLEQALRSGTLPFEIICQHPERDRANATRCLEKGTPINLAEVSVTNAVGESFIVMQSFIPVINNEGKCVGVIQSFRDVTAEARMYGHYKELITEAKARSEDLEREVHDRTRQLAAALEQVTQLSRVDPLTGVLNRRAFTEHATQALKLAERHGRSVGILMCDLDHFKELNDAYGHQSGDKVLIAVAQSLANAVRETDKVGRFGGEEFLVLLSETSPDAVMSIAERCYKRVRDMVLSDLIPEATTAQTISIGVAVFPEHGTTLEQLIANADRALYHAKDTGRNRTVMYHENIVRQSQRLTLAEWAAQQILIVDTDPKRSEAYLRLLNPKYGVVLAESGREALSICKRHPFDAIIADEYTASESGLDLLKQSSLHLPTAVRMLVVDPNNSSVDPTGPLPEGIDHVVLRTHLKEQLLKLLEHDFNHREHTRNQLLSSAVRPNEIEDKQRDAVHEILRKRAITIAYQPIISSHNFSILAYEALCRVTHPLISGPAILFEVAQRIGSLWPLGRLVRERIVGDLQEFQPLPAIFVNIHPSEIGNHQLLGGEEFMLPWAKRMVFEITERSAIPNFAQFQDNLRMLRALGYRFAIDDLGAGYSSLNSIAVLEPDFVKIDMTLIRNIHLSSRKRSLVRSIIDFGKAEGIQVIAEGIENEAEVETLLDLGCPLMQGYHFSRPKTLGDLAAMYESHETAMKKE